MLKRNCILICCLFFSLSAFGQRPPMLFGVSLKGTYQDLSSVNDFGINSFKGKANYGIGFNTILSLNQKLLLLVGVGFATKNYKIQHAGKVYSRGFLIVSDVTSEIGQSFLEIPLSIQYPLNDANTRFFINAGFTNNFRLTAKSGLYSSGAKNEDRYFFKQFYLTSLTGVSMHTKLGETLIVRASAELNYPITNPNSFLDGTPFEYGVSIGVYKTL